MTSEIFELAIESITAAHIDSLIASQMEEGPRFELKRALATNDGRADRWMRDQSLIGSVARDDIAKEVVAFANAYGGVVIIGIEETDDNPKRARSVFEPLIPAVHDCADRLVQSLRSIIDPPLPMLEARGIEVSDGAGVIVVQVGSSPSAPHGFGRPSNAYVRRGSNSEPLVMRDIQAIFYERRTRLERVARVADEQFSQAEVIAKQWRSGHLMQPDTNQPVDASNGLLFQLSLISSEDLAIDNLPDRFHQKPIRSAKPNLRSLVELPNWTSDWKRGYRSALYSFGYTSNLSKVTIRADGLITLLLVRADNKFHPSWYSAIMAQGFFLTEWVRRWLGRPDVEFVVQGKFEKSGNPAIPQNNGLFDTWVSIPWDSAVIGPYSLTSRSNFPIVHDVIEREVWDLFGSVRDAGLQIDWNQQIDGS
ncbi:Putative DNA-binding domain-containing protein [Bradyrhizobium sp. Ghvi]|uniref:AlbA family DNA-binding domain-containing protein n=1 Tax=Bradyrhizobium sp. Ghvi TaxID=1855319 RepID=UPI0008E33318|nr:ATP-binding protein [Bradyrhizobium sp. Ghvi]SFO74768.1 Putative DNA-binding domain-containing protein [Bradyrhizobium sp. Ghvi]